jgi:hypothetical protein
MWELQGSLGQFQRRKEEEWSWGCLTSTDTMDRYPGCVKTSSEETR